MVMGGYDGCAGPGTSSVPAPRARRPAGWLAFLVGLWLRPAGADSVLVFNEIMYNPPGGNGDLEWVELYNQMGVDLDISGWSLAGGLDFSFPEGTIVKGWGFLVVAASPPALQAAGGPAGALGPFQGRLDDNGERLELRNNNLREMDAVRYRDFGDWPVGPDGSGATLAKLDPDSASAPAANWVVSLQVGGTPGAHNFPTEGARSLPAGLVSYWNFDEPSGRALDSADSNHGTAGTGATRVAGLVGTGALSFDNTANAYVSVGIGTDNNFAVTAGIAIEVLVKPLWSGAPGDQDEIFRKEDGNNRLVLSFQNDGNGNGFSDPPLLPDYAGPVLAFGLNVGGSYKELDMPLDGRDGRPTLAELKDGRVHHLAAVYDSTSGLKAIYVDGARAYSTQLAAGGLVASGGGSTAYLGNMNGRAEPFTGVLDELAFWNRALGEAEVSSHSEQAQAGKTYFSSPPDAAARPALALNEIFPGPAGTGWVEIINSGNSALELKDYALKRLGAAAGVQVFPAGPLGAGARLVRTSAELGFDLLPGDRLFLYAPGEAEVLDAARIENRHLARRPEGAGRWLVPDRATPGAPNSFAIPEDLVINEIMYHHRPIQASPGTSEETVILPIDTAWKYDQSGQPPPAGWRELEFDDGAWPSGKALFFNESAALPAAKNTEVALGPVTYYFRTTFEFKDPPQGISLVVRTVIDDGAVIYLNGTEVYRYNMFAGAVDSTTLASPSVGDATYAGPFTISAGSLRQGQNLLAVEVHQGSTASNDVVFGLVLASAKSLSDPVPFGESPESWIEIFNRGSAEVDLTGWGLEGGIDYRFERGTRLAAGAYLLVAGDQEHLKALYPTLAIAGNFQGRLSYGSDRLVLVDPNGNPADEVEYFDGGRWPEYADGGGSSLELRDPYADNSKAEAWAASDETGRSTWKTYSYQGPAVAGVGPTIWREFVMGLLDAGEALIDDLSVIESPGGNEVQLIANGGFEAGSTRWRFLGNHGLSEVVTDPENPANHVLHLVATGATEHMHNHLETTFPTGVSVVAGRQYRISFRARWLAGSNQLNTRLYFNRLPRTTLLELPQLSGTPGARNSSFEENIGPTYSGLSHRPVAPGAGEAVTVSVRAEDPDGVECTLRWSVNGGQFNPLPMTSPEPGLYRAEIPPQAPAALVQFYVEAKDGAGKISMFPAAGPASRALYRVKDGQAVLGKVHNLRILMTQADINQMHLETNVMSNHRLGCTIVYDERVTFYDCGVRIKGSERGRPTSNRVGYNIRFPADRLFRGVHEKIHIDRSGGWSLSGSPGQDEILIKHMINKAGGIPGMYDDLIRVIAPRPSETSSALLMMARFDDIYLDSQYQNGGDGQLFKLELIYYPTTTINGSPEGLKRPQPDEVLGTDLQNLGNDKEAYRWTFMIENHLERDDYSRFMELCKAFSLPPATIDQGTRDLMDLSEWMRSFAMYSLAGVNDAYSQGNNHNLMFYVRPSDNKVLALPWDMDFSFNRPATSALWGDQNLAKIIALPSNQRVFHSHLRDLIDKAANPTYMAYWTSHYGSLAGQNYSSLLNYISQRRSFVLSRLPQQVPFTISTNGGQDLTVNQDQAIIEGNAWYNVKDIMLSGKDDPLDLTWTNISRWRTVVKLAPGLNALQFLALDLDGNLVGSDTINVTSAVGPQFIRGDPNLDQKVDLSDPVAVIFHLYLGVPVTCEDAADSDDDETLNLTDAVYLIDQLFQGGPTPPAPFPLQGVDPRGDALGCATGL